LVEPSPIAEPDPPSDEAQDEAVHEVDEVDEVDEDGRDAGAAP
jgi:hypothetical protein